MDPAMSLFGAGDGIKILKKECQLTVSKHTQLVRCSVLGKERE